VGAGDSGQRILIYNIIRYEESRSTAKTQDAPTPKLGQ